MHKPNLHAVASAIQQKEKKSDEWRNGNSLQKSELIALKKKWYRFWFALQRDQKENLFPYKNAYQKSVLFWFSFYV